MAKKKFVQEYLNIPLTSIVTDGQSVRSATDDDHVIELAVSIMSHGLLEPIVVRPLKDGKYQLLAGFHRLCAFHRIKEETIPAVIHQDTKTPTKVIACVENIVRRSMTLAEEITAVTQFYEVEKMSPSQICELLGKSRAWVDQRLMIPHLYEDIVQDLLEGRISIKHAEELQKIDDRSTRAYVLNQIQTSRLSSRQTAELVNIYLDTPSIQSAIEEGLKTAAQIQDTKLYRKCASCGKTQLIENLSYVAICRGGCVPEGARGEGEKDDKIGD